MCHEMAVRNLKRKVGEEVLHFLVDVLADYTSYLVKVWTCSVVFKAFLARRLDYAWFCLSTLSSLQRVISCMKIHGLSLHNGKCSVLVNYALGNLADLCDEERYLRALWSFRFPPAVRI